MFLHGSINKILEVCGSTMDQLALPSWRDFLVISPALSEFHC